jgi:hypothetical protein
MNVDADGNIKVHEQGVVDVNLTNSSTDVTGAVDVNNFPATQDVNIVGSISNDISPVTIIHAGFFYLEAGDSQKKTFDTINATSIHWSAPHEKKRVSFSSPATFIDNIGIFWVDDTSGAIDDWSLNFTSPVPIDGVTYECKKESNHCGQMHWTITGFLAE